MKGLLSPLRTGLRYEWIGLIVVAPLLMFPTVRPWWTAWALITLFLLVILRLVLRREAWPVTPFNGALFLFVLMVLVSVLVTAAPELTLAKATNLILGLACFRAMGFAVRGRRSLVVTWALLLLVGLGIIAVGLMSTAWSGKVPFIAPFARHLPAGLVHLPEAPKKGVNPNQLGWVVAFYVPLVAGALFNIPAVSRRVWASALLVLSILLLFSGTVLLLTQSRSGWIGGFGGTLLLLFLSGVMSSRRGVRMVTAFAALAAVAGAIVFLSRFNAQVPLLPSLALLSSKGIDVTEVGRIDMRGRLEIWSRAIYALQDFPFTGIGLGTFRRVTPLLYPYFYIKTFSEGPPDAHNLLLQAGVDFGFPGLIAYLALILIALGTIAVHVRGDGWERTVAFSLLGGLVGIHLYGLTDIISFGAKPGILFWMAIGLLGALANIPRVDDATAEHD